MNELDDDVLESPLLRELSTSQKSMQDAILDDDHNHQKRCGDNRVDLSHHETKNDRQVEPTHKKYIKIQNKKIIGQ